MENSRKDYENYILLPIPHRKPSIPLKTEKTIIGRKLLSELNIRSNQNKKKLNVSRNQAELSIVDNEIKLKVIGLNPMMVMPQDRDWIKLAPGEAVVLKVGDSFNLCGAHFPFLLAYRDPTSGSLITEKASSKKKHDGTNGNDSSSNNNNNIRSKFPSSLEYMIGKKVKVFRDNDWYYGRISKWSGAYNCFEVIFDKVAQGSAWIPPHKLTIVEPSKTAINNNNNNSNHLSEKRSQPSHNNELHIKKKIKVTTTSTEVISQERGGGIHDSRNLIRTEEEESEEALNDDGTRKSRRAKKSVFYAEWQSSSSEEEEDQQKEAEEQIERSEEEEDYGNDDLNRPISKYNSLKTYETVVEPQQLNTAKPTCVLWHEMCLRHYVPPWHLEKPQRLQNIMEGVRSLQRKFPQSLVIIENFPKVTNSTLTTVHEQHYLERVEKAIPADDSPEHVTQYTQELEDDRNSEDFDTFMSHHSLDAALLAAGAVCRAVDLVAGGIHRNAFCAVRPPGHHCGAKGHTASAKTQGYCIINNVAIGAIYAMNKWNFKRVAVVDFDVHHGNGTEEVLGGKSGFLFISIHVGAIYPHTGLDDRKRANNVVNISLKPNTGSEEFQEAVSGRILPALDMFNPEIILLSSGFDGHKKDPTEDGLRLDERDFYEITEKLKRLAEKVCNGRLVSVLEGGYHLPSLRRSVKEHLIALMMK